MEEIIGFVEELGGVLTLRPGPGDGSPEISWGDVFLYFSPVGVVPPTAQPFATVVTKDYPEDKESRLDRPDTFRVNIAAGKEAFTHWTGHPPREPGAGSGSGAGSATGPDLAATDTVLAHPVYGPLGWLAVVNPGPRTGAVVRELLRTAHHLARTRHERRAERTAAD